MRYLLLLALLYCSSALGSQAMLTRFFENVKTMQANFSQQVLDESGDLIESSEGVFYLSRPGKFRWDYNSDDPEISSGQKIIADGKSIYMFDPDLEQVTKRSMNDALSQVPSLVLVQSNKRLQNYFEMTDLAVVEGVSWVALKPTQQEAAYEQLKLGFKQQQLQYIVLQDGLGNETRLTLSQVKNNLSIPASRFQFKVPEGADLLTD